MVLYSITYIDRAIKYLLFLILVRRKKTKHLRQSKQLGWKFLKLLKLKTLINLLNQRTSQTHTAKYVNLSYLCTHFINMNGHMIGKVIIWLKKKNVIHKPFNIYTRFSMLWAWVLYYLIITEKTKDQVHTNYIKV
jgi:hypothetical protein